MVSTLYYLFDLVGINSTEAFLALNKEEFNTSRRNLSGSVDEAVAAASRVECGVLDIQASYYMALAINFLANRDVNSDATLLDTLGQHYVLNLKRFMQNMVATKSNTDGVYLTKLPNNMQPKTSSFKSGCTTIEEELYQNTSADGISLLDMSSVHPIHLLIMNMCNKARLCYRSVMTLQGYKGRPTTKTRIWYM